MQDLVVSIIQSELHWEDIDANLAMFEEKIWQIDGKTDVIILPEMFSTGFSMSAKKLAEPMNSKTFRWMKQMAEQTGAVVCGSFIARESERFYNRFLWMNPDASFAYYDKRHLFRMAKEHETYSGGSKKIILSVKGWRIMPLICYDLRFPVYSRQDSNLSYDCLIYVANWPERRSVAWNTLLRARAIENLSYVIGVNRVGKDGNGHSYSGDSSVIQPDGEILFTAKHIGIIKTITLKAELLETYRKNFPAFLDSDEFEIKY
jgi:omega-amidase